jgi:hypothetical protein
MLIWRLVRKFKFKGTIHDTRQNSLIVGDQSVPVPEINIDSVISEITQNQLDRYYMNLLGLLVKLVFIKY